MSMTGREYLGWQDTSKRSAQDKLAMALDAYHDRYGCRPPSVVVSVDQHAEIVAPDDIVVTSQRSVARDTFLMEVG
ncbi:MAG: hypothetical protein GYA73_01615 [Planctomycetes bacterium]|jgi:hypothetical protein|nr:hypothetical protein [Planctomycetota bacterium]